MCVGGNTGWGPVRIAPYKHHFGKKISDFDGGPYKDHLQNWEFDVSLLRIFGKRSFLPLKQHQTFFQELPIEGHFVLDCYF